MNDFLSQMQEDTKIGISDDQLQQISTLATRQVELADRVEQLEEQLENAKRQLREVQEQALPTALLECGVSEFKLVNGRKITIKKFYSGSIGDANRDDAFAWLKEHGHDDIVKNDFTITFGKGEDSKAETFMQELTGLGVPFKNKKHVHPQTLSAFIREQVEGGADFPLETFNAFIGQRAIIK